MHFKKGREKDRERILKEGGEEEQMFVILSLINNLNFSDWSSNLLVNFQHQPLPLNKCFKMINPYLLLEDGHCVKTLTDTPLSTAVKQFVIHFGNNLPFPFLRVNIFKCTIQSAVEKRLAATRRMHWAITWVCWLTGSQPCGAVLLFPVWTTNRGLQAAGKDRARRSQTQRWQLLPIYCTSCSEVQGKQVINFSFGPPTFIYRGFLGSLNRQRC